MGRAIRRDDAVRSQGGQRGVREAAVLRPGADGRADAHAGRHGGSHGQADHAGRRGHRRRRDGRERAAQGIRHQGASHQGRHDPLRVLGGRRDEVRASPGGRPGADPGGAARHPGPQVRRGDGATVQDAAGHHEQPDGSMDQVPEPRDGGGGVQVAARPPPGCSRHHQQDGRGRQPGGSRGAGGPADHEGVRGDRSGYQAGLAVGRADWQGAGLGGRANGRLGQPGADADGAVYRQAVHQPDRSAEGRDGMVGESPGGHPEG